MVIFHADWCPACQRFMQTRYADVKNQYGKTFVIEDQNTDKVPDQVMQELDIKYLPTVVLLSNKQRKNIYGGPLFDPASFAIEVKDFLDYEKAQGSN
jgi:thioredoxin-like negative regulator of GroEL